MNQTIIMVSRNAVAAVLLALLFIPTASVGQSNNPQEGETEGLVQTLLHMGISPQRILGVDLDGIPLVCGTTADGEPARLSTQQLTSSELPAGTRGWETIPGVIRNDGLDTFRVEVDVNGPVAGVAMNGISAQFVPPESQPIELRDDGQGEDRVAGDFVYTSGLFRYNTSVPMPDFYMHDPTSPAGLDTVSVGKVSIEELDGTVTGFLIRPSAGILRFDIPETSTIVLSTDITISPHLINIRTNARETQRFLRFLGGNLRHITHPIYEALPDTFDFFVFFSTNKIERLPFLSRPNFNAGVHSSVQVNYTGTGLALFDNSAAYGSNGRLLGLNVLDAYNRGVVSNNATHEIIHQWVSFTSTSLGLSDGTAHYKPRSSVGSLVGGFRWLENLDGTFSIDCTQGRNGAHNAPPLDKYMMGLIDGYAVAPLYAYSENAPSVGLICTGNAPNLIEIDTAVTIDDIQSVHDIRTPGPEDAQRDFAIAFVAESHGRMLNPTEMTFYEMLAEHYTTGVDAQDPDPYLGFNWAPISRFFGEGTTWSSDVLIHEQTVFTGASPSVPDAFARLSIHADFAGAQGFRWESADPILGAIDTGYVPEQDVDMWIVVGNAPARLAFRARRTGVTFSTNILFEPYNRAVVDVVKDSKRVRYFLDRN